MLLSRFKPFICEQCANHVKALLFQSRSKVSANPSVRLISRSPANDNLGIGSSRYYGTRIKPKLKQRSPSYRHSKAFEDLPEEKISREPLRPHQPQSSPFKSQHPSSQPSFNATQPLPAPRQLSLPLNKLTEYYIDTREINSIDSDQVKQFTEQVFASIEESKLVTPDSGKETNAMSGEMVKSDYEKATLLQELNAVLYQNALLGRADVSKKALDLIQELNLPVSSYSFNNLILAHVRSSDLASAEKTFHFMHSKESPVKPNEYTYGIIMAEMVKQDRLDDAVTLFERLQEVGLKPTQPIFTSLATGFIAHGHVDKAYKLLEEMTFRYCLPDEVSYSTLIDACAKTGETERALFWLDALTAKNLHPTDVTFNALINACASRKDYYLTAFSILEQMQDVGFRPDAYTNSALMNACSRVGDVKRAGIIWNSIVQDIKGGETGNFTKYLVANLFLVFASRVPHLNTSGAPSPSKSPREELSKKINRSCTSGVMPAETDSDSTQILDLPTASLNSDRQVCIAPESVLPPVIPDEASLTRPIIFELSDSIFNHVVCNHPDFLNSYLLNAYFYIHVRCHPSKAQNIFDKLFDKHNIAKTGHTYYNYISALVTRRSKVSVKKAVEVWKEWENWFAKINREWSDVAHESTNSEKEVKGSEKSISVLNEKERWLKKYGADRKTTYEIIKAIANGLSYHHPPTAITLLSVSAQKYNLSLDKKDFRQLYNRVVQTEDRELLNDLKDIYESYGTKTRKDKNERVSLNE